MKDCADTDCDKLVKDVVAVPIQIPMIKTNANTAADVILDVLFFLSFSILPCFNLRTYELKI
jgi:hypothetical protein